MSEFFTSVSLAACESARAAAEVFSSRLSDRGIAPGGGLKVVFREKAGGAPGWNVFAGDGRAELEAASAIDFFAAAGELLRALTFRDGGAELPALDIRRAPRCEFRGAYFASHFHNWYITAPDAELHRYIEDLALWGFNWIETCFPAIDLPSEFSPETKEAVGRLVPLFEFAHGIGMKVCIGGFTNGGYKDYPAGLKAGLHPDPLGRRGNTGNMLCYAKPETRELMDAYNRHFFEWFAPCGIDMLISWPYDEGGCGCPECAPWGAKGFISSSKRMFELAREYFPGVLRLVSTWCFDTPPEGEWEALSRSLEGDKWCDVIMADAHEDFPRYPLDVGVPGGLPLISFPEISMWGLSPWGGWGATALPGRFSRLWNQTEGRLSGGFLYSEGIFEDINKILVSQFWLTGSGDTAPALDMYARWELGCRDSADFIRLISGLERTHTDLELTGRCSLGDIGENFALASSIGASLPGWGARSWRWRQIYLRALIDSRRYPIAAALELRDWKGTGGRSWEELLGGDDAIRGAMAELCDIYHSIDGFSEDPYHGRVRPVLERRPAK